MKKAQKILCFLLTVVLCLALPVLAAEVTDEASAKSAVSALSGETVISWSDFYQHVSGTTSSGKGVLTRVTGAEGAYSSYIQYQTLTATGSENSHTLFYDDADGTLGLEGNVAAGDALLLRMVIRSVGTAGKSRAATLEKGVGTTSKPSAAFEIPTEWTEIYMPLTSGGVVNYLTLRFGYFNQTVQIADFSLVNYGSADGLPSGTWAAAEATTGNVMGGSAVTTDMFPNAMEAVTGDTLWINTDVVAEDGDILLLTMPVRGKNVCSKITVYWDFTGTDVEMTYYAPVQWSNLYMPVKCDGALNGITVSVDTGCVQVGTATVENMGAATFEDLALKSGLWLLEDFDNIVLPESAGVKANNEAFYTEAGITSGRTADVVLSSDGKYIYSIGDGMLTVTDVTDPANPVIKSKLTGMGDVAGTSSLGDTRQLCLLPGKGTDGGDAVIFTCRSYGAFIFDMADPANPVELAHYDALEMATGLAVYGDYAFICSRFYGVEVVDLSDPSNPIHLCTILNEGGEVQSCKVVDGILYAGEYNNNCVSIYDVTDPLNYKKLGTCVLNGRGDGMAVATVGDRTYLYAGTGHHSQTGLANATPLSNLSYGQGNGLDIFDVTDPANPVWLSTSKIDGRFYNTSCDFWSAEYAYDAATGRSYAYLVSTFNGLYVFDVTDPAAPVRVGRVALQILPDSDNYGAYGLTNSSRAFIYNFDTTGENPTKYGAVGSVACADGVLYIGGASTDLYVYEYSKAFAQPALSQDVTVEVTGDYYTFDAFAGCASATVEGGQTYAVDELDGYIYVAAGAKGIQIYDKDLNSLGSVATDDICYDLYIQDGKLYTAEGRAGVAIYTVDGLTLTETWRHVSNVGQVTAVRPSVTGKFVALHVGAVTGQIVRVSDSETVVSVKAASQMYHHNVTGLVAGRYMGFWANSSSERWYDFGENDSLDTPVRVTGSSSGYAPIAAMTGGITAYGDLALATGNGGYYLYDPSSITADEQKALTMIKPVNGSGSKVGIYGKATIAGNTMISCDRIYGRIYITDISDINNPVLLAAYGTREGTALVGNPDIAKVVGNTVYIPLGYMGIVKLTLEHQGHCLCNADITGHDCTGQDWQAWGDSDDELGTLPTSGSYYLVSDITAGSIAVSDELNLCLNGYTVTTKATTRIFKLEAGGKVNITDCRQSGEMVATNCSGSGAIAYLSGADAVFSLYGGTLRGTVTTAYAGTLIYANAGTVNIHGGVVTDGSTTAENGGNIYMNGNTTLNMTGGVVQNGSSAKRGANIYIQSSASKPCTFKMSGGKILFGEDVTPVAMGGNIYINIAGTIEMSGGIISGGQASSYGGNIYVNPTSKLVLSGGTIENGYAENDGGNIYLNAAAQLNLTGCTVEGGTVNRNGSNIYGGYNSAYATTYGNASAVMTIDVMGRSLTGIVSAGQVYGLDSTTHGYTDTTGSLELTLLSTGSLAGNWKNADLKRYLTIENEDGTYSFHRFYIGITRMSLRPNVTGVGYKAVFAGSDKVKAQLDSYGFNLWVTEDKVITASKEGAALQSGQFVTLRLQNFDVSNYGETPIYGSVFIKLNDGTVIESATYQYTLQSMLEAVAADITGYTEVQMLALKTMCEKYAETTKDWAIDSIRNYEA